MAETKNTWHPAALKLVRRLAALKVDVLDYTLMNYISDVHVTSTTSNIKMFLRAVATVQLGNAQVGTESTFASLKFALELSPCHNFIVVFTDEVGDETDNWRLKKEILNLKAERKSEIFFLVSQFEEYGNKLPEMRRVFEDIGYVIDLNKRDSDFICARSECNTNPTPDRAPRKIYKC